MSLQFSYRDDNGDFQGIQLVSSDDIADKFAAPKNVLQSQTWPDITVTATYFRGTVFIEAHRLGQDGEAFIPSNGSDCGLLTTGYAPSHSIRQLLGTKSTSGGWLLLEVNPDRKIRLVVVYADGETYSSFSGSLSYAINK